MVIDINDTLLDSVKKELLVSLRIAEERVIDMFEFGETHGADETFINLNSVRAGLILLNEKGAVALCESVIQSLKFIIDSKNIDEDDDLIDSFLTLSQYVERLTVNAVSSSDKKLDETLLANAKLSLSGGGDSSESKYRLEDSQRVTVVKVINALNKVAIDDESFWQYIYKTTKAIKESVNTYESYLFIWLVEQISVLNVKGQLAIENSEKESVFNAYKYYLGLICEKGESLSGYRQVQITSTVTLIQRLTSGSELIRNDFRPPVRKLEADESALLTVVFPVSAETIEAIAFLVKKELTVTKQIFEELYNHGQAFDFRGVEQSLKLPKATFRLLGFQSGEMLIDEAYDFLKGNDPMESWEEKFTENIILIEDALWHLDRVSKSGIVNRETSTKSQKEHTKKVSANTAKFIVAQQSHAFVKITREKHIECFNNPEKLEFMEIAREIHGIQSSQVVFGELELATLLKKSEQINLFLVGKSNLLASKAAANPYLDMLVGYELIFEQLKSSLEIDQRALKLIASAQSELLSEIKYNPEQMAASDYSKFDNSSSLLKDQIEEIFEVDEHQDETENIDVPETLIDDELNSQVDPLSSESHSESGFGAESDDSAANVDSSDTLASVDSQFQSSLQAERFSPVLNELVKDGVIKKDVDSVASDELDEDILDIFIEEGQGIYEKLSEDVAQLRGNYHNQELIDDIRRSFHTLKGSGRMVRVDVFGEFAWQFEELFNKVVSGSLQLNDLTQELLEECAIPLIDQTVNSSPFVEDKDSLLKAAAQAESVRKFFLSGAQLPTEAEIISSQESSSEVNSSQVNSSQVNSSQVNSSQVNSSQVNSSEVSSSQVNSSQVNSSQVNSSEVSSSQVNSSQVNNSQVGGSQVGGSQVGGSQEITKSAPEQTVQQLNHDKLQNISQTANFISDLNGVTHDDLKPVFGALQQVDRNDFDETQRLLANKINEIGEQSSQKTGLNLDKTTSKAVSEALEALVGDSHDDVTKSIENLTALSEEWKQAEFDEVARNNLSWASDYTEQAIELCDEWRKDGFVIEEKFNLLHQHIIPFSDLLISKKINNPVALIIKLKSLCDITSVSPVYEGELKLVVGNTVIEALAQTKLVLKRILTGDDKVIPTIESIASIEKSINLLHETEQHSKAVSSSKEVDFEGQVNSFSSSSADSKPNDALSSLERSVELGYLGTEGALDDFIGNIKTQFDSEEISQGSFDHQKLIESLYDVEASLKNESTPPWAWEALSNIEDTVSNMEEHSLQPSSDDYNKINDALDAVRNSGGLDLADGKKINNSLMGMRAGLSSRTVNAELAKSFASNAEEELKSTDKSFDGWKDSGFTPDNGLDSLIENIDEVGDISQKLNYTEGEELSSLVGSILTRLKDENVVPFEEISDIVSEAISEITKVNPQHHGGNLVSDELKQLLDQQAVAPTSGAEYVPIGNSNDLNSLSPLRQQEANNESVANVDAEISNTFDSFVSDDQRKQSSKSSPNNSVDDIDFETSSEANAAQESACLAKLDKVNMTSEQKKSYVDEVAPYIFESKSDFENWEKTGFTDEGPLQSLAKNVRRISSVSNQHNFESAENLGKVVNDVLERVYKEVVVPSLDTTKTVSDALEEFDRSSDAIKSGADDSVATIKSDLLQKVKTLADAQNLGKPMSLESDVYHDLVSARDSRMEPRDFDFTNRANSPEYSPETYANKKESINCASTNTVSDEPHSSVSSNTQNTESYVDSGLLSYVNQALPHINSSKDNFEKWKGSSFESFESLDNLSDNVKTISDISDANDFTSAAELTDTVGGVLSQISNSKEKPLESTASQIESAIEELTRSAEAIQNNSHDFDVRPEVISTTRDIHEQLSSEIVSESPEIIASSSSQTSNQKTSTVQSTESYVDSGLLSYVSQALPHINSSKDNFEKWKGSSFESFESLDNLSDNVKTISDISDANDFTSAAELTETVGGVLSQISNSGEKPLESTTSQIESAIEELTRSAEAIQNNSNDFDVKSEVIETTRAIREQISSEIASESPEIIDSSSSQISNQKPSTVQSTESYVDSGLLSYVNQALPHINSSKDNFEKWKGSSFESFESLDNLSDNVKTISDISDANDFASAAELTETVGGVLSQISNSGEKPLESTTSQIESAIEELTRSAEAIQNNSNDFDVKSEVIETTRAIREQISSEIALESPEIIDSSSSQTSNQKPSTVQSTESYVDSGLLSYVNQALPHINSSKDNFEKWKGSSFESFESLDNLSDNVKTISDISDANDFTSVAELTDTVGGVLSQISSSGEKPLESTASQIESAIEELTRSAEAIQNNSHDFDVSPEVISTTRAIREQVSSDKIPENLEKNVDNKFVDYVEDALPHIQDSKNNFGNWKESLFELNDDLGKLSHNVKGISQASIANDFHSAAGLADTVNDVLSQISTSNEKPLDSTAYQIESALNEFARSANAIQFNDGDVEICPTVAASTQTTYEHIMSAVNDTTVATGASSLPDLNRSQHDVSAPVIQQIVAENSVTKPLDVPIQNDSSDEYEDLKSNDPAELDETILDIYLDEAKDLVVVNDKDLSDWGADFDNLEPIMSLQRGLHTLKGGARMAELSVIGDLSHNIETLLDAIADNKISDKAGAHDVLSNGLDISSEMVRHASNYHVIVESPEYYEMLNNFMEKETGRSLELPGPKRKDNTDSEQETEKDFADETKHNAPDIQHNVNTTVNESHSAVSDTSLNQSVAASETSQAQSASQAPQSQSIVKTSASVTTPASEQSLTTEPQSKVAITPQSDQTLLSSQLDLRPTQDFEETVKRSAEESEIKASKNKNPSLSNHYEGLKFNDPAKLDEVILDIFLSEAQELVLRNEKSLGDWKADYDDLTAIKELQRSLHTLKGGARMAELTVLGDLSHNIEALLDVIADGRIKDKDKAHVVLLSGLSLSGDMVTQAKNNQVIVESPEYYEELNALLREQAGKSLELPAPKRQAAEETDEEQSDSPTPKSGRGRGKNQRRSYMMRVSSDLIDKVTSLVGEDVVSRSRIERNLAEHDFQLIELSRTVDRVSEQLRRLENETEAQILFRHDTPDETVDEDFDPLELDRFSEIQQLSRLLAESMHDLENIRTSLTDFVDETRQILLDQSNLQSDLQDSVLSASLVKFDSVAPRFEKMVSQIAKELGKEAIVQIYGGNNEIERNMLEDLVPGFEHTIRNSIAHGIELPDDREKMGKPRQGRIRIAIRSEGAEISFMIADDGRGANLEMIKDKAKRLNMLDESRMHDKKYLLGLLFEPGFSTQEKATQISGRGIGMDVLRDAINTHRGNIEVESESGKGMATFIRMPFAMSIIEALTVKVGQYQYAVPVLSVEGIARISQEEYEPFLSGQSVFYKYGQNRYKLESLINFFDPYAERVVSSQGVSVLLIRIGSARLALEVDEIFDRQEVIVKSVNPQFTSLPGIIGATVLDNGMPVPVLEATMLGRHFLSFQETGVDIKNVLEEQHVEHDVVQPRILVVDDSITMRKVTSKILNKYDIEHQTAKDGLDAINVISDFTPDVILLDIEMPRMDGFEFATHIRSDSNIPNVPIIMITSRTGEKHRERAESIGVNDYLGKPYSEEVLINSLERVLIKKLSK